jgi:hypothetical protein
MAKELMEIGGFITEGAEIVNHDNTLSGNGTVDSPLGVVPGYNETVLFDGSTSGTTGDVNLSEEITNFERVNIFYSMNHAYLNGAYNFGGRWMQLDTADLSITKKFNVNDFGCDGTAPSTIVIRSDVYTVSNDLKTFVHDIATQMFFNGTSWAVNTTKHAIMYKVIGINRKA